MAPHLSNEEFFSALSNLLASTSQKSRGSVYLTQKPLPVSVSATSTSQAEPGEGASQEEEQQLKQQQQRPSILIRATDGNTSAPNPKKSNSNSKSTSKKRKKTDGTTPKIKISTIVAPDEIEAFYARYAEVCKAGMSGLKKRDRKKAKTKAKGGQAKVTKG